MTVFSVVSILFIPPGAIGGFFGMNVRIPWQMEDLIEECSVISQQTAFFWIVLVIAVIILIMGLMMNKYVFSDGAIAKKALPLNTVSSIS